jgi:hypothetical protein
MTEITILRKKTPLTIDVTGKKVGEWALGITISTFFTKC